MPQPSQIRAARTMSRLRPSRRPSQLCDPDRKTNIGFKTTVYKPTGGEAAVVCPPARTCGTICQCRRMGVHTPKLQKDFEVFSSSGAHGLRIATPLPDWLRLKLAK